MKNTITVRLPDELQGELRKVTESEKVGISDIVRESLRRYVAVRRFRKVRDKVLPFAEAQGLLTDEDIFKILK